MNLLDRYNYLRELMGSIHTVKVNRDSSYRSYSHRDNFKFVETFKGIAEILTISAKGLQKYLIGQDFDEATKQKFMNNIESLTELISDERYKDPSIDDTIKTSEQIVDIHDFLTQNYIKITGRRGNNGHFDAQMVCDILNRCGEMKRDLENFIFWNYMCRNHLQPPIVMNAGNILSLSKLCFVFIDIFAKIERENKAIKQAEKNK